jgi:hypothetical protein
MPYFDSISCNFTPNTFKRLQELRSQWNTFENIFNESFTLTSTSANIQYTSFEQKELVRQGQILHNKVFPTSNWVLPFQRNPNVINIKILSESFGSYEIINNAYTFIPDTESINAFKQFFKDNGYLININLSADQLNNTLYKGDDLTISNYDVLIISSSFNFTDTLTLSNNIQKYLELGGSLILMSDCWSQPLTGFNFYYSPFSKAVPTNPGTELVNTLVNNVEHPINNGLNGTTVNQSINRDFNNTYLLQNGAILITQSDTGLPLVAINQIGRSRSVALNYNILNIIGKELGTVPTVKLLINSIMWAGYKI